MTSAFLQVARNAMSNASRTPVTDDTIRDVLTTGDGPGNLVRALFGDCPADILIRLARDYDMTDADLEAAYRRAKTIHKAAHAEFDAW